MLIMAKFDKAHAEIRLYLPLDSVAWEDFRKSPGYAALAEAGLIAVHKAQKRATTGEPSK